ncbi:hypothetical protein K7432_008170 [Basidiobolus ranarum]|uniref:Uncharacterized protein n=1 Tax=Basidiobolus ranarum TaxID=34480 RepID=A0ABR2VZ04_9FUNG
MGYFVIAGALGGVRAFQFDMGLKGLWLALCVALIVLTLGQSIVGVAMADWEQIAEASQEQFLESESESESDGSTESSSILSRVSQNSKSNGM